MDKVVDFYLTEMPNQGFEKTMGETMGEGYVSTWVHESKDFGVSVVIAEQEDGKTVIAIVAGK